MIKPQNATRALAAVLLLLSTVLLAGCINLARAYPEKNHYAFNPQRTAEKNSAKPGEILRVQPFRINILFGDKEMIFRKGEQNFEADFYNQYTAAPRLLITDRIREWLGESGIYESVIESGSRLRESHILEGYIQSLYGDLRGGKAKAVIEIQFTLISAKISESKILLEKTYSREIPLERMNPENLAAGLNRGLEEILTEFEQDLAGL